MAGDIRGILPVRTEKVGPFILIEDGDSLDLRFEARGELSFNGCLVISLLLCAVLTFGVLAIVQFANDAAAPILRHGAPVTQGPALLLDPLENHFGLVWLFSAIGVLIVIPFYVARTYRSALTYSFRRLEDVLLRNGRVVTQLRRIEHLIIQETQDPDDRYLYGLELAYGDGLQLPLHTSYDEREVKNLANEIATFVDKKIVWRQ